MAFESGPISGNGEGFVDVDDFMVRDIRKGRTNRINGTVRFGTGWYITGSLRDSDLEYDSPLGAPCEFEPNYILRNGFCQIDGIVRTPGVVIDESVRIGSVAIGRREFFGDHVSVYGEVGVQHFRWKADDDVEAVSVSGCGVPFRIEDCTSIRNEARESAATGLLGISAKVSGRFSVHLDFQLQSERHRVWRTDVAERFYEANCVDPGRCVPRDWVEVAEIEKSSWTWFTLRGTYSLSRNWFLTAALERGGSRGWAVSTAGVGYRWK